MDRQTSDLKTQRLLQRFLSNNLVSCLYMYSMYKADVNVSEMFLIYVSNIKTMYLGLLDNKMMCFKLRPMKSILVLAPKTTI